MSARALVIPASHPAYDGHFPGHPILPAVVMLAEVLAHVASETGTTASAWSLQQAKFIRSVGPGDALAVACEADAQGGQRFELRHGDAVVASGRFARAAS